MRSLIVLLLFSVTAIGQTIYKPPASSTNAAIALGWTGSTDTRVTGYYLYQGALPGIYTNKTYVGNVVVYTNTLPRSGATYYWTVTAANSTDESPPCNEVNYHTTPQLLPASGFKTPVLLSIQFRDDLFHQWADAGMEWMLTKEQAQNQYRLQIVSVN